MIPVVILVLLLFFAVGTFGTDTLSGASQLSLLFSGGVAVAIGMCVYKLKWAAIERAITSGIGDVTTSILILLVIGALSGAWMASGIVPGFIYYGMKIIHPKFFLATACAVCAVVSIMTGSSWTTIATIGLALIGIGRAQGFDVGIVAGAIISGSYFGDKMSPLSDTTVLTASVTETPIFTHIRYMMWTTVPAMFITLVIFIVLGLRHDAIPAEQMASIGVGLSDKFNISPLVFVVPAVTVVMIALKTPSLIALFISALLGALFALVFQPDALKEVAGGASAVKGAVKALYGTASFGFADKTLADLTESGGMTGMLNTVWLII